MKKQWKEEHLKVDLQVLQLSIQFEILRTYSFVEEIIFFKLFVDLAEKIATKLENKLEKIAIELGKGGRLKAE